MVSNKRMRGLLGYGEASEACAWQIAVDYVAYDGEIWPNNAALRQETSGVRILADRRWKNTSYYPLTDPNLFPSFARLGARGDELSEAAILRWVRKHGLLQLKDPNEYRLSIENQAPVALKAFREEASQAYNASTLLNDIRSSNIEALRSRVGHVIAGRPDEAEAGSFADVYVDGLPIPLMSRVGGEPPDKALRSEAVYGLEWLVNWRLRGVNLSVVGELGHPGPQEAYRPKLTINVPDLWRAIWYQFALHMSDARSTKFCEVCEGPIFRPRRDQKTCSDACRQRKSRRNRAREAPS